MFDDLLAANGRYQAEFHNPGLRGRAAKQLAVLTCIDSRIDPLAMLGLQPGDAKIVRNAGARVTNDALRSLILATNLLDVRRICVVQHTDCAMVGTSNASISARIEARLSVPVGDWDFLTMSDQATTLSEDLAKLRSCDLLPRGTEIGGFMFDVANGRLSPAD